MICAIYRGTHTQTQISKTGYDSGVAALIQNLVVMPLIIYVQGVLSKERCVGSNSSIVVLLDQLLGPTSAALIRVIHLEAGEVIGCIMRRHELSYLGVGIIPVGVVIPASTLRRMRRTLVQRS